MNMCECGEKKIITAEIIVPKSTLRWLLWPWNWIKINCVSPVVVRRCPRVDCMDVTSFSPLSLNWLRMPVGALQKLGIEIFWLFVVQNIHGVSGLWMNNFPKFLKKVALNALVRVGQFIFIRSWTTYAIQAKAMPAPMIRRNSSWKDSVGMTSLTIHCCICTFIRLSLRFIQIGNVVSFQSGVLGFCWRGIHYQKYQTYCTILYGRPALQ